MEASLLPHLAPGGCSGPQEAAGQHSTARPDPDRMMDKPTASARYDNPAEAEEFTHWRRNLIVCVFGSFTTIVAMTLMLPFLPLYVEQLGVKDHASIVQWSGVAYGATFFTAALVAPLWGWLADLYGRKLMLIRASLGMAVAMSLIGM